MTIELEKTTRATAVASVERYLQRHFADDSGSRIGNVRAAALLDFMLAEIAPSVYNLAVAQVQARLLARVAEVDIECHEAEFEYREEPADSRRTPGR